MDWKIRLTSDEDDTPIYDLNDGWFTIKLHHGGEFSEDGSDYRGGLVSYVDYCNADKISMLELIEMSSLLGYKDSVTFYHKNPSLPMPRGLRNLITDQDVLDLVHFIPANHEVQIYLRVVETVNADLGQSTQVSQALYGSEELIYLDEGEGFMDFNDNIADDEVMDFNDNIAYEKEDGSDEDDSDVSYIHFDDSAFEDDKDDDKLYEANVTKGIEEDGTARINKGIIGVLNEAEVDRGKTTYDGENNKGEKSRPRKHKVGVGNYMGSDDFYGE